MSVVSRIRRFFRSTEELDAAVEEQLELDQAAHRDRALRDPFRFTSEEHFEAYRTKHGLRTRRRRESTWADRLRGR